MQPGKGETHFEPARQVPVYGSCDVLVLGGGPGGTAAAIGAAAAGADTVLVERYGHLGGLASGGHVCFIDRMTDWDGRLVVAGVGEEFMDRCGVEAGGIIGPEREYWGSRDAELVEYWGPRANAHRGVVAWSPHHRSGDAEAGVQRPGARARRAHPVPLLGGGAGDAR